MSQRRRLAQYAPKAGDARTRIVVVGKENTGKTQLIATLTGKTASPSNFRGATIACETYAMDDIDFVDTPGIIHQSDTETTRAAIEQLDATDTVLVIAQATHLDDDLKVLLPLVQGKRGCVVVSFWDKVQHNDVGDRVIRELSEQAGVPVIPVNACQLSEGDRERILAAIRAPQAIDPEKFTARVNWRLEPEPTVLEHRIAGPILGIALLLLPAVLSVWGANRFAEKIDPLVQSALRPVIEGQQGSPALLKELLVGSYGFITMGPLLLVWAVPTVMVFALILGVYKASGLLDRIAAAVHPVMRPFGIGGRDVIRIIMGYGCNVPAVINTRACSSCSRGTCISAIAFGSVCSYQMGATLAVLAAAGKPWLVLPFMGYLLATMLIYTRFTSPARARSRLNVLLVDRRVFLVVPRMAWVWREARMLLAQFFKKALPIFFVITLVASLLSYTGVLAATAGLVGSAMQVFNLPADAGLAIVMSSIRKDGLILLAEPGLAGTMTSGQVLTALYLGGTLLPCLVTVLTIAAEQSSKFAAKLVLKQVGAAVLFSIVMAWGSTLL